MTALISLNRSLVVRHGTALYGFNRSLDDGQTVQLENQHTGAYRSFSTADFYSKIERGELVPVLGDERANSDRSEGPSNTDIIDFSSLPEKVAETLTLRQRVVRYMRKAQIRRGQRTKIASAITTLCDKLDKENAEKRLPPVKRPSSSTVMDWMRRYEASSCNAASLLSGNQHRRRAPRIDAAQEKFVLSALDKYYLVAGAPRLQNAYDQYITQLRKDKESKRVSASLTPVSFATFSRRVNDLDPYMVLCRRYGPDHANKKLRVTMDGTLITRAMQRYEIDHTLLNWIVICDRTGLPLGRPTLTVVLDSATGYVTGIYVSFNGPDLTSVMNVIKNALRPKGHLVEAAGAVKPWIAIGIPDGLILDNGLEFHAHALKAAAWQLSCDLEYCKVRTPWLKPKVERFFADLDHFSLTNGRVFKPDFNLMNIDPKKDASITLSQLCRGLILFAVDTHNYQQNSKTLAIPAVAFAESLLRSPAPSLPISMAGLDMIAALSKELTVSHGGVEFYGLSYAGYELKELLHAAGGKFKTNVKWNPDDLRQMHVQHPRTAEWVALQCTRGDYATGLSWNQHRLIRKFLREKMKLDGSVEHLLQARVRLSEIWLEPLAKKNKSPDMDMARRLASQVAGGTSTFAEASATTAASNTTPAQLVAPEESTESDKAIPQFEAIQYQAATHSAVPVYETFMHR